MRKLVNVLLIMIVAGYASSCVREKDRSVDRPCGTDDTEILLRLRTPGGFSPVTRGMTFEQENAINDVYVLVFDKDGKLGAIKEGHDVSGTTTNPVPGGISGTGSFKFTIAPSNTSLDTYNLVILVNAATILSNTIGTDATSGHIGDSYADVQAAVYESITGKMYPSGGAIPMWGETGQTVISPSLNGRTIQLMRSVARIDVGVGQPTRTTDDTTDEYRWDGMENDGLTPIPFELKEVYIISPNNRYSVIPVASYLSAGNPTVPAGTGKFTLTQSKGIFAFSDGDIAGVAGGQGGWITRAIYIPEADVRMGDTATPGDANHKSRMAVVVGGDYGGSGTTTYYRLDFARSGDLFNVLRNHLYQFNISKVAGAGHPTVEEAYNSMAINMQAEVLDWNEFSAEIYDDGVNWVRLWIGENSHLVGDDQPREAILFRKSGSTDRIRFSTSLPLDAMTLAMDQGGIVDPDNKLLVENARFRAEVVTADTGETYFEFTAMHDYDATALDNPSILTVTIGRITFAITITQRTSERTDWIDGGTIPKDL